MPYQIRSANMKHILLLFLFPSLLWAQQKQMQGKVINDKNETLANVTVVLMDSLYQALHETRTDASGKFTLSLDNNTNYYISTRDLNYQSYEEFIQPDTLQGQLLIRLSAKSNQLEEVLIEGKRPRVTRKVDRLEFNVQNSNISALSSWEILKRTPLVKVLGSDISIKGSRNILVMINDKPVTLTGEELKNLLENSSGTDVQAVEVITNPPAKYEASGTAIINIKMKQNQLYGYRGVLLAKAEQSNYGKQIFGLTNYFKTEKFNFKGIYNFGRGTYARYGTDYVQYASDNTTWISKMDRIDDNKNQQTYVFTADYNPDSTLTLSFGWNGFYSPNSEGIYRVPTLIYNQQQQVESSYLTTNDHYRRTKNNNLFLQLVKKLSKTNTLDWATYYTTNNRVNYQDILTELNFKDQDPSTSHFTSDNDNKTRLFSSQVDFSHKGKRLELEFGGKYSYVSTFSKLIFADNENGELAFRPEKSSDFDYQEHNVAGYGSASYQWKKWSLKAGLRAEYTNLTGTVSQPSDINKTDYLTLFPTFYAQYETNDKSQIGFSYGKRISRPSYSWLNPTKSYYNLFSYFQGDARLRATIVHNLNLTYTRNNWNIDLFYRYEKWPSMEISYQDDATHNLIYHYTNIEKGQGAGIDISKNLDIKPWWSVNGMLSAMYNENYFEGVDKLIHKNDVYQLNTTLSTSFILNKKTDWNVEVGNSYYSPSIQGPFRISGFSSTYLVMNRKFIHKKLELSLYFLDIFKSEKIKVATNYANQNNYFLDYQDTQKISATLRFNFGNQTIRNNKTIRKTDEQNRL